MKARVNYVIATWSGERHTTAKDYLKVHLSRLFELKHNLDQVTVVIPLGSDNADYYDVGDEIKSKTVFINRPEDDRSYGQFIYAYQQYTDQFTHYIIVEDDYVPNLDNFDSILVDMIESKSVDYLCGKYAKQTRLDRDRAIMNQGIVKASAFKKMLELCDPKFPIMGPEDGTEQLIFSEYFTNNGMRIGDYSNEYSVPFWSKTLMYFSEKRGFNTLFVPYQCVSKNTATHFLSTLKYTAVRKEHEMFVREVAAHYIYHMGNNGHLFIIQESQIDLYPHNGVDIPMGYFKLYRENDNLLYMDCVVHSTYLNLGIEVIMYERLSWENRSENLFVIENDRVKIKQLRDLGWEIAGNINTDPNTGIRLFKDYRTW